MVSLDVSTPSTSQLGEIVRTLRQWQFDGGPIQLHPGDLGWHWRFGAGRVASDLRVWRRAGTIVAVGLTEGRLIRLAIAPQAQSDERLARRMLADLTEPQRGVLPAGEADVEARFAALLRPLLLDHGWAAGEPWTPLSRDLTSPVEDPGARIELVAADGVADRVAVQRAAFARTTFTADRWRVMAHGPAYADARCVLAYDDRGTPVAAATVWSAGQGKPGLLEPMGVHRGHRARGYGRAITLAAAATLQTLGSCTATVCTETSNTAAVATYRAAGFRELAEVHDLHRSA